MVSWRELTYFPGVALWRWSLRALAVFVARRPWQSALVVASMAFACRALAADDLPTTGTAALAGIDGRIEQLRKGNAVVELRLPNQQPVTESAQVRIVMVRHAFLFGANLFRFDDCKTKEQTELYRRQFAQLFNYATLPFYWRYYEQQPDRTDAEQRLRVVAWCRLQRIVCKGHPLVWVFEPDWVQGLTQPDERIFQRVEREVEVFRDKIDIWDVVNESVWGADMAKQRGAPALARAYEQRGTLAVVHDAFARARKAHPKAKLILNDFETAAPFEQLIEGARLMQTPFDIVGLQSHMHDGYWGADRLWDVCQRFGSHGYPLHFTEATIVSGRHRLPTDQEDHPENNQWHSTPEGEQRQALQVVEMYRLLFSHPAVEAISWWDLSDQGAWLAAPAGLLNSEMRAKPAYFALRRLLHHDWKTDLRLFAGPQGRVSFRGFFGDYRVEVTSGNAKYTGLFTLRKDSPSPLPVMLRQRNASGNTP